MAPLRRFYKRIEKDEVIQEIFFILNLKPVTDDCLICFEKIEQLSENVVCDECNKPFHTKCMEKWFNSNQTRKCPHCRNNWKFEIDIIEIEILKVELDEHSILPSYSKSKNKLTVRGSIAGEISRQNLDNSRDDVGDDVEDDVGDDIDSYIRDINYYQMYQDAIDAVRNTYYN